MTASRDMAVRRGRRVVVAALVCTFALSILLAVKVIGEGSPQPRPAPERAAPAPDDAALRAAPSLPRAAPAAAEAAPPPAPGSRSPGREEPPPQPDARQGAAPARNAPLPRPGAKPVMRGLIVPDDFPLPPGYLRHYQATPDGEPLPPILMFHPDYQPVDASGRPVTMPDDFIVPPEMAPPGMPLRMLEPPPANRDSAP